MNPRAILLLLRLLLILFPAVIGIFGWTGRKFGLSRTRLPPEPTEDVGNRPLKQPLPAPSPPP